MSRTQVQLWYNRFKEDREDVNNDIHPGRPITSIIVEIIEAVKKIESMYFTKFVIDTKGKKSILPRLASPEHKFNCGTTGLRKANKMSITMLILSTSTIDEIIEAVKKIEYTYVTHEI